MLKNICRDLLALLAGWLFTLAFSPYHYAYFAPIALVILFASWQNTSQWRAILRGYLFGLSSFGLGVSWVYISIHDFGGADMLSSAAMTVLFVLFWSLFPALAAFLSLSLGAQKHPSITAFTWILVEYFRGAVLLNGFPWLLCAYSQLTTPLAGYVPIVGAYGTGFLLALSAILVVRYLQKTPLRKSSMLLLVLIWLVGGLLQQITWTHPSGEPFRASLVQGNITQDQKWRPENRLNTLLLYKKLTEAHWDSQVIIWPETAIPAYLDDVDAFFLTPLQESALAHGTDLVVSLPMTGKNSQEIYNGVISLGKERGIYRKNHLLPFGEYMPWQPLSGFILKQLHIRLGDFTPGGMHQTLLTAAGYPFMTSICYEDAFGDANISGLPDAAYLVNVTNDGWFGNSIEPHQHLQIAAMRALETGRYMLRATNTGATAVIAPDGKILSQAPLFETTVLTDMITPMSGMTPYAHLGDQSVIVIIVILLLIGLAERRRTMR